MTEQEWIEQELKKACEVPGCMNYASAGYICCIHCLHGRPPRLPEKVIKAKKAREQRP